MQEMIVLQTEVENSQIPENIRKQKAETVQEKEHRPIVAYRPESISRQKDFPINVQADTKTMSPSKEENPFDFSEQNEEKETDADENEFSSHLPQITADLTKKKTRSGYIQVFAAVIVLGLFIWAYPKICPVIDRFCYQIVKVGTVLSNRQDTVSDAETDDVQQEEIKETPEDTSSDPETPEKEKIESTASESDQSAQVIGTIDNTTGDGVVNVQTFSAVAGGIYVPLQHGLVKNVTEVSNAVLAKAAKNDVAFELCDTEKPQVLIMHTHTTESYLSEESSSYNTEASFRTKDNTQNMVRVGEQIVSVLEQAGIGVLHDTTLHDYPSYSGSYARSAETVKKYLEQYPSVKIVLDIHRDAIGSNGSITAPTTTVDGRKAAQIMIISGCDDGTMDMPNYLKNFAFAAALQNQLEQMYPTLTRPVLFDYRKYNQDLTTGSLLIEIGSNANTLDQAVYAGELFGNALAKFCLDQIRQ